MNDNTVKGRGDFNKEQYTRMIGDDNGTEYVGVTVKASDYLEVVLVINLRKNKTNC